MENHAVQLHRQLTEPPRVAITNPRVLAVMADIDRGSFVPPNLRHRAYDDCPLPIGDGQTISQPYIVARMTELLAPSPGDRILEIGTGSGYQTAILSRLAAEVFSIETIGSLARQAAAVLDPGHYPNIHLRTGDGHHGWPEESPFDGIIVTCAPEKIPSELTAQLREGGRLVIPVGREGSHQELLKIVKCEGNLLEESVLPVRFVPMTGDSP